MRKSITAPPSHAHEETPWLRRRGVSGAVAESDLLAVREFLSRRKVGRSRRHEGVTLALKGCYSNRPPDKAVIPD